MDKVMVELVLDRPGHKDLLYGSGQEWIGKGDVQPVAADLWPKLAIHTDVYRLAEKAEAKDEPAEPDQPEKRRPGRPRKQEA